ncbi:nucleotidyltransferase domain-containing protein, partial [Avibacterium paragallinarum]
MFTYAPATPLTIQSVKQQKEQLKAFELAEFSVCSVYALLANRTAFYDQLMQHLWRHFGLAEEPALSLIAVGGYGRGEMFPLSDLDFLILAEKEIAGDSEQKISQMVQFLWDCGFDVGHAVRTLSQCEQEGKGDI